MNSMFFFIRRQVDGFALQMNVTIVCNLTDFNLNYHPKKITTQHTRIPAEDRQFFFFSKAKKNFHIFEFLSVLIIAGVA